MYLGHTRSILDPHEFFPPKEEEEGTPIICPYPTLLPCSYGGGRWVLDFGE